MTGRRIFWRRLAIAWVALSLVPNRVTATAADVIVVCPETFRDAMQPWVQHRRAEGLTVSFCAAAADASTLRHRVAEASDESTRYVLLVGDAPRIGADCRIDCELPICYAPAKVTAAWGSTPTLATDFAYGDFDRDGSPEAAVGRLPVHDPEQLEELVGRILSYENSNDFGLWRSRVQLTGGVGGFGAMADAAIEAVTRSVVTTLLPADTSTSVAYASPGHPFFPTGKSFTDAVLERYQHGSRFWVYAGHGWIDKLDRVPHSADGVPVLDKESVQRLHRDASGAPIAVMLACYTGAVDAAEDSLAEQMLLVPGGPIAVIAGSRVTMPYGNATAAVGLIESVYHEKKPRLGDAWLGALEQMNLDDDSTEKSMTRMLIDTLAAFCSPADTGLADERREHMQLYNLIGDPTLKLHHPKRVEFAPVSSSVTGNTLKLQMTSPIEGNLTLSVARPLGTQTGGDPNDTELAAKQVKVHSQRPVEQQIELPDGTHGPVVVRAMVSGITGWASGALRLNVR